MKTLVKILGFTLLTLFFFSSISVYADTNNVFSITPLDPTTGNPQSSYYDLTVSPKEKKEMKVRVTNSSDKEIAVSVELNDATTNNNGITSYLKTKERDSTLKIGFSDIAETKEKIVKVPKNSSVDIPITVHIPEQSFSGVILGGIRISMAEEEEEKQSASVTSKIAYTIGVLLREDDAELKPAIVLNDVKAEQRNYRNYVGANLQNTEPVIVKNLEVSAKIMRKGKSQILYEAERYEMRMAPNSNFDFGISLQNQAFSPGVYTLELSGVADDVPFEFSKDFEIEAEEAKKLNKESVFVEQKEPNYWVWLALALVIISIACIVMFILVRKRRRKNG